MAKQYETVIGLEVHVELATKTKIFCGCSTAFGGAPNTHTCPVCTGMPGSLPVLNKQVVEYAMGIGLATHCDITRVCKFDRKNYFYPDNPQNYQISQLYQPIAKNGYVEITVGDTKKKVRIHEMHMEEDAGKLVHDEWDDTSLVDFNRSGVPLVEIVSEPDMRSSEEVIAYLEKLRTIIQYLGASDCKLQEGSMRADVNLSVREVGTQEFGTRTEMKNLNSFKAIARAIEGERERQIELIEEGKSVIQETRRWDDNKESSHAMRSKEDAQDYRYFPEPDLAPIVIDDEWIEKIKEKQPEFRDEKLERYKKEFDIPQYDAEILTESKHMADIFEETTAICGKPKKVSNWLMVETMRLLKEHSMEPEDISFSPANLAKLIGLTEDGTINSSVAKEVFEQVFEKNVDPEFHRALEELVRNKLNSIQRMKVTYGHVPEAEILDTVFQSDIEIIKLTMEHIDHAAFEMAVETLLSARTIYIIGIRSCAPLASFLSFYLNMILDDVRLIQTSSASEIFEQMIRIGDQDAIIGISFPRYSMRTLKAIEFANNRNAKVITLTDSVHSPINLYSSCNLIARSDMASIVDSLVAPLSVVNALVVALCMKRQKEVVHTLETMEKIWDEYQVYSNDEMEHADDTIKMLNPEQEDQKT